MFSGLYPLHAPKFAFPVRAVNRTVSFGANSIEPNDMSEWWISALEGNLAWRRRRDGFLDGWATDLSWVYPDMDLRGARYIFYLLQWIARNAELIRHIQLS